MAAELFFRPESIEWLEENRRTTASANTAMGIVERVTFLGNSADVLIRCGEISVRARTHPTRTPVAGKAVRFTVAPSSCIVFPA